jgi:hypothetical protein
MYDGMKKTDFSEEIDTLLNQLISDKLVKHTCQFFEKDTNSHMKPYGSGVFAFIHNNYFILTASHVAEGLSEEKDLFIQVDKNRYVNVLGEIKLTDIEKSKGVDIAYIKLQKDLIEPLNKPHLFLTIDKFRRHNNLLDASNYCIIGFPENNVKKEGGLLKTGATAYFTQPTNDRPYEFYNFSKEDCYIFDIKGKGTNICTGESSKVNTHFYGISGCGLWLIIIDYDEASKQHFCDYRLIGIMTEFRKGKYFCLIGNKIQRIIDAWTIIENFKFKEIPIA